MGIGLVSYSAGKYFDYLVPSSVIGKINYIIQFELELQKEFLLISQQIFTNIP